MAAPESLKSSFFIVKWEEADDTIEWGGLYYLNGSP